MNKKNRLKTPQENTRFVKNRITPYNSAAEILPTILHLQFVVDDRINWAKGEKRNLTNVIQAAQTLRGIKREQQ